MGSSVPFVASAMLTAAVSAASEKPRKPGDALRSTPKPPGASRPEPRELVAFLQMNPEEKFDIEAINAIDAPALVGETHGDKRVLREVLRTAESLLPRVRAETEDPLLVSAILRAKTFDWYDRSPSDPGWVGSMPLRWGGIFFESRVPGGRLSRKLSVRLTLLINQCVEASGAVAFLRAGVAGIFRGSAMMAKMVTFTLGSKRPRLTQQVAQAYLDDLASTARRGDAFLPLERLSDLARRNGSSEVGMTLLCQRLSDGNLVPEADTDGDYLEAELDHPDKGHPDHRAKDGQWNIGHGWTVVRERADGGVRTYRAESKSAD